MHYSAIVIVPDDVDSVEEAVGALMAPWNENTIYSEKRDAYWDWYQIGGRFTGMFDDYDPGKDPANFDPNGTVQVDEKLEPIPGAARLKWPTQWKTHPGDIVPVSRVPKDIQVCAILTPEPTFHVRERWVRDEKCWREDPEWPNLMHDLLTRYADGHYAVAVDYHC